MGMWGSSSIDMGLGAYRSDPAMGAALGAEPALHLQVSRIHPADT